jgi:hypothetical protein
MSWRAFAVRFAVALAGILGFGTAGFAASPKKAESEPAFLRSIGHPAIHAIESQVSVCRPRPDAHWRGFNREYGFKMDLLLPPIEVNNRPDWTPFICQVDWVGGERTR